jgi:nicotinamidase/pyrazinamidase
MRLNSTTALIVVDVQNDFCPATPQADGKMGGGALAVPGGHDIVPLVNRLAERFENIILTQDWHPAGHISFASSHAGKTPFGTAELPYGRQVLWPDHCIQGTHGAELHAGLVLPRAQLIVRKGYHKHTDSYSAFLEADRKTPTGLDGYLASRGIKRVFCVGLALDFCVAWTALDARRFGLAATVIEDACRAIDAPGPEGSASAGSLAKARSDMIAAGVNLVRSAML